MKADALLAHLDKVRTTGNGRWTACCPHHKDKSPSLAIRELDDGRVLLHCFAGCSVEEILSSVGLTFDALFPDKVIENCKPVRRPFAAADVLECVAAECLLVAVAAANLKRGMELQDIDYERLVTANVRIQEARSLALG